jgi:hypothetical protein
MLYVVKPGLHPLMDDDDEDDDELDDDELLWLDDLKLCVRACAHACQSSTCARSRYSQRLLRVHATSRV